MPTAVLYNMQGAKIGDVEFIFTISCDESELPADVFEVAEKI